MMNLCSIVSNKIDQLEVKPKTLNDMKTILERLHHLSKITFENNGDLQAESFTAIIQWLQKAGIQFENKQDDKHLEILFHQNDRSINSLA